MKTLPPGLDSVFDAETTTFATCWKLTTTEGTVIAVTDHDEDIVFDGVTYLHGAGYTPSAIRTSGELDVDELELQGLISTDTLDEADLDAGLLDFAEVIIFVLDYTNLSDPAEKIIVRKGHLGEVSFQDGVYQAELRGLTQLLQQRIGETIQRSCRAKFGSGSEAPLLRRCGFDATTVEHSSTIDTVISSTKFNAEVITEFLSQYNGGTITFTSGNNTGRTKEIKIVDNDSPIDATLSQADIEIVEAYPEAVQAGDSYTITPGCDKKFTTCRDVYDNVINFRGEPFLIGNDALAITQRPGGSSALPE